MQKILIERILFAFFKKKKNWPYLLNDPRKTKGLNEYVNK